MVIAVGRPCPTSRANVGPDSTATAASDPEHFLGDLVRQQSGLQLEALGRPREPHLRLQMRRDFLQHARKAWLGTAMSTSLRARTAAVESDSTMQRAWETAPAGR